MIEQSKHGQGTHIPKMGNDNLVKNTPNAPKNFSSICLPKPKRFWSRFYIVILGMTFFSFFTNLLFPIFIWTFISFLDFYFPFRTNRDLILDFFQVFFFIWVVFSECLLKYINCIGYSIKNTNFKVLRENHIFFRVIAVAFKTWYSTFLDMSSSSSFSSAVFWISLLTSITSEGGSMLKWQVVLDSINVPTWYVHQVNGILWKPITMHYIDWDFNGKNRSHFQILQKPFILDVLMQATEKNWKFSMMDFWDILIYPFWNHMDRPNKSKKIFET